MDHKQFQEWLSGIEGLSPAQRQQAQAVLLGEAEPSASLAAIEARVAEDREYPHCGTPGAVSRGKTRGLRRYQCKACNKTFNAATGTALQGRLCLESGGNYSMAFPSGLLFGFVMPRGQGFR